jgi:hypothetical protein
MVLPLMPKATAVWLVENTALSFEQIAAYTGMHELEIQAIADGEVAVGIVGVNPVTGGQLTPEEIARCEADPVKGRLKMTKTDIPLPKARSKGARYTPVSKRQDRPDAINWILKHHSELTDAQISRLLGTTKATIASVRDRSHWNSTNIKPQNPVTLVLAQRRKTNAIKAEERKLRREAREAAAAQQAIEAAQAPADAAPVASESAPSA